MQREVKLKNSSKQIEKMESYSGPKYRTIFLGKSLPKTRKSGELIKWFRKFYNMGLAPEYGKGSSGNLSFRHKDGFMIKSTATYFKTIRPEELAFVKDFDFGKKIAYVYGRCLPSTELQMHCLIYRFRLDVGAVFHLHDYKIMESAEKIKIPITKVTEAGTVKIGYDVLKVMGDKGIAVMKDHGIVAIGRSMKEAGDIILKYH
jgi:ribulose-5-phosphate 4-epimerase/fuculose-1-phosphate aldolase